LWTWRDSVAEVGAVAARVHLIQGRAATVQVEMDWRGPARAQLAWLAGSEAFAKAMTLPAETTPVQLGDGQGYVEGRFRLPAVQVRGLERGRHRGLRCGLERNSRLRLWRLRQWRDLACEFAVYPDPGPGRGQLLRSPVFRALAAATLLPQAGQGREFERLRDYQAGDTYGDVSWKATARRAYPVTRLYQWERQQEIHFVVDHSRLSRGALELFIETALVGASAASDMGDRFGLLTASADITGWLPAGSGRAHFHAVRERLLRLEASPAGADRMRLCAGLSQRLRRRCYILLLANLTERGQGEEFLRAAGRISRTHVVLAQSVQPAEARPLAEATASNLEGVYTALAGDTEFGRLETLRRRLRQAGIEFRATPAAQFLGTALGAYLNAKREQRL
ncbi:MAG: DUF58 domain-containing protein, partial [Terriglobales bacterium]